MAAAGCRAGRRLSTAGGSLVFVSKKIEQPSCWSGSSGAALRPAEIVLPGQCANRTEPGLAIFALKLARRTCHAAAYELVSRHPFRNPVCVMSSPRTRSRTLQEIDQLKDKLRHDEAAHGAAVQFCKEADTSAGGFSKAGKYADDQIKEHTNAAAAIQLNERMLRKNELGDALLTAVTGCDAVQGIHSTHLTEKEAYADIATQLYNIAALFEQQSQLKNADKLNHAKQVADRKLAKAQAKQQELVTLKTEAFQEVKRTKARIKVLEESGAAAPLALTNGGASGLSLPGFRAAAEDGSSSGSDDDDDQDDSGGSAAAGPTPSGGARKRRRTESPPATEPKSAAKSIPDVE